MRKRIQSYSNKSAAPLVVLLAAMVASVLSVYAEDSAAADKSAQTAATPAGGTAGIRPAALGTSDGAKSEEITLSDLRDVGLCVMQIKQQAINVYLEATREPIAENADAKMLDPSQISVSELDASTKYLPTRPEWLTFYVGTMEPIIHLFQEDMKDTRTGAQNVVVPKGTKEKFEKLLDVYETAVEQLNSHLSNIYDQIAQPDNNLKIAREAIKIFELANEIEKDRQEAFRLIQSSAGEKETERINLKKKE